MVFPEHGLPPAGEARHQELRRVRRAGRVQRLRLRARDCGPVREIGQYRNALVVGAEIYSRILDWKDRGTCVLFGDGAGAVVLERSDRRRASRVAACMPTAATRSILSRARAACRAAQVTGRPLLQMEGNAVFKFAVKVLGEVVGRDARAQPGLKHSRRRLADSAPGQHPHHPGDGEEARARAWSSVVMTVDRHANTSAASVPLALDEAVRDGRIRPGQHVLLEASAAVLPGARCSCAGRLVRR